MQDMTTFETISLKHLEPILTSMLTLAISRSMSNIKVKVGLDLLKAKTCYLMDKVIDLFLSRKGIFIIIAQKDNICSQKLPLDLFCSVHFCFIIKIIRP